MKHGCCIPTLVKLLSTCQSSLNRHKLWSQIPSTSVCVVDEVLIHFLLFLQDLKNHIRYAVLQTAAPHWFVLLRCLPSEWVMANRGTETWQKLRWKSIGAGPSKVCIICTIHQSCFSSPLMFGVTGWRLVERLSWVLPCSGGASPSSVLTPYAKLVNGCSSTGLKAGITHAHEHGLSVFTSPHFNGVQMVLYVQHTLKPNAAAEDTSTWQAICGPHLLLTITRSTPSCCNVIDLFSVLASLEKRQGALICIN